MVRPNLKMAEQVENILELLNWLEFIQDIVIVEGDQEKLRKNILYRLELFRTCQKQKDKDNTKTGTGQEPGTSTSQQSQSQQAKKIKRSRKNPVTPTSYDDEAEDILDPTAVVEIQKLELKEENGDEVIYYKFSGSATTGDKTDLEADLSLVNVTKTKTKSPRGRKPKSEPEVKTTPLPDTPEPRRSGRKRKIKVFSPPSSPNFGHDHEDKDDYDDGDQLDSSVEFKPAVENFDSSSSMNAETKTETQENKNGSAIMTSDVANIDGDDSVPLKKIRQRKPKSPTKKFEDATVEAKSDESGPSGELLIVENEVSVKSTNADENSEAPIPDNPINVQLDYLLSKTRGKSVVGEELRCVACDRLCLNKSALKVHLRLHLNLRPYVCEICGKTFNQQNQLTVHGVVHTGEKVYLCEQCPRRFSHPTRLKKHIQRSHAKIKPFECEVCHRKFAIKGQLQSHSLVHTDEITIQCEVCAKGFRRMGNYRTHMRQHTGERPYECKICGRGFAQIRALVWHKSSVHKIQTPKRDI